MPVVDRTPEIGSAPTATRVSTSTLGEVTALILAGGLGTRLRSEVADRPKVLAPVNDRPFLAYLLDRLAAAGVGRATLCVGYMGEQVRAEFGEDHDGLPLSYSFEQALLGTGGALRLALPTITGSVVMVLNGDSCFDTDLGQLHAAYREAGRPGCIALARVDDTRRYGRVKVEKSGRITGFVEKSRKTGPGWINAGIYLFDRDLLRAIPAGGAVSLEKELFPGWASRGVLHGHRAEGPFLDIGTPESYARVASFLAASPHE